METGTEEGQLSEPDVTPQPGVPPAVRGTAGPMFAALYGELVPYAWHDPRSEHDAYQLFHQRSVAMGWLDDRSGLPSDCSAESRASTAPGLWGMNDAGWGDPRAAAASGTVAWFQVECSTPAADRPLPVQPFLRCAEDTVARIGTVRLSAVQILLPLQGVAPESRPPYAPVPSMGTRHWFGERDPRARTAVRVGIDSGRDPVISTVAQQLAGDLAALEQDVFLCGEAESADRDRVPPPPFHDDFWNGPPLHGMTLHGELAEWSCDAVGWLAATLADAAARLGVRTPLLFEVTRG
ncbi:hypothetical protein SNE510_02910 [Streptomyces sp. NE5-10]|nr:hypothetical protein SNE510_02910 [Streptomyces sp. NE5-10]